MNEHKKHKMELDYENNRHKMELEYEARKRETDLRADELKVNKEESRYETSA